MAHARMAKAGFLLLAVASAEGCTGEAAAPAGSYPVDLTPDPSTQGADEKPAQSMLDAMQRDLGMTDTEARETLATEAEAARTESALREQLADAFGGAWMKSDHSGLKVAITDAALSDLVSDMGAEPVVVTHSFDKLLDVKGALDALADSVDPTIHNWYVDVATNAVVVSAENPDSAAVQAFVAGRGEVRVVKSAERPVPFADLRGGDQIILNRGALCSVGFAVNGGYVTAGHCGKTGQLTQDNNWVDNGVIKGSTFPGNDWAYVQSYAGTNTLPLVNNYAGGTVSVTGSQVASVGSSICRSGRTTGWRCGTVQAQNVTINYADGPVYGATQTTTCAEGGDSGGSFISGSQAQGVTSGGSGNCTSGGTTFFQPLNPILSHFGVTLKTSGSTTKAIVSRLNDKCIDVPNSNFVDGARLQMWGCNGTGAQQWTFTGGTIRAGGKCMDVANANPADGTPVQLVNCNGNVAQQFVLNAAGDLVSVLANKCVDIGGWDSADGAKLIIWPCHGGNNQKWYAR